MRDLAPAQIVRLPPVSFRPFRSYMSLYMFAQAMQPRTDGRQHRWNYFCVNCREVIRKQLQRRKEKVIRGVKSGQKPNRNATQ